jgi:hypothetical protein
MTSINQKLATSTAGLVAIATLFNAPLANAAIIVNNGYQIFGATMSDFDGSIAPALQLADQFTLTGKAQVKEIMWRGLYFDSGSPLNDNFTIRFFKIVQENVVEPPIEFHLGSVARQDSGVDLSGFDVFDYSAMLTSFSLDRGDYLLSIVNNTIGEADDWFWGVSSYRNSEHFFRYNDGEFWERGDEGDMAFAIAGESISVPEPSTILGIVFALGLGAISRKSKTK